MRLVSITSATKGALDNKVIVDNQMVTSTNLTAMVRDYAEGIPKYVLQRMVTKHLTCIRGRQQ